VSLAALLAVPVVERRVADPIIDLNLVRNRVFTSALVCMTLAMLALFAIGFQCFSSRYRAALPKPIARSLFGGRQQTCSGGRANDRWNGR
jgi:hypothetical protein